ncbi:MAG: VOC family protein [Actinomycetota bacterium]|nr:VOC family protein [Actinomycetota bacterium]
MRDVDPLSVLATPIPPVAPAPSFTADLRARLHRALDLPTGVVSTVTVTEPNQTARSTRTAESSETAPAETSRVPRAGALPYLAVRGARAAIEFYADGFGAETVGEPYVMGDGRIGHAELAMGGGSIYLSDEHPEIGVVAPAPEGVPVSLMIEVADTDAALERLRAAGARVEREPYENYGARNASVIDPFGHRWMLSGPMTAPTPTERIRPGDVAALVWRTPDADRAARFYTAVLGWSYDRDRGDRGVRETAVLTRIEGGHERSTLVCVHAVTDVAGALGAVRAAGGQVGEPAGGHVLCADDQGVPFGLAAIEPGTPRPAVNGRGPGDASYITYGVPSSQRFRDFYSTVFGWRFEPGRMEDGWGPVDTAPMIGLHGGGDGVTVAMWKVADVHAAADRVIRAGGVVIEPPNRMPYGTTALCTDDQGARFYLGDA